MGRNWWGRFLLFVFFTVLSIVYIYPTLAGLDLQKTKFPFKQKINLGLDLQGGLYMVLGVDFNKVFKDVVDRQAAAIKERAPGKNVIITKVETVRDEKTPDDPKIVLEFEQSQREALYKLVKDEYWNLRIVGEKPGHLEYGLSREYRQEVRDKTINQSIEVIRNRIDEFGVAEPQITSQGSDRVVVELPGVKDVTRAKDLIGRTAKLEFKIVDDKSMATLDLPKLIEDLEKQNGFKFEEDGKFSEYVKKLNEGAKGKIPEGSEIAFEKNKFSPGGAAIATQRIPYLLFSRADVTGDDLQDATVQFDQETQRPNVGFSFNPKGAANFGKLTESNLQKRLAIVLDGIVHSAPVIQSRISDRGQITLGQGDRDKLMTEAKDLAIVLRAGALPAQLDFLEQRVVGPSLGQDSIKSGATASIVGSLAVFLLIAIIYQFSGMIAAFSLMLNVIYVLAILVGMEATLTLPGIAGIALTVGIAVDSNIVIFERIREELRAGKGPAGAIEAGFQKAFRTILDANVTNAAAALVLFLYGSGPVKGFAVTLLIGIVTTLFSAIFVCKLFFDVYLRRLQGNRTQTLSI